MQVHICGSLLLVLIAVFLSANAFAEEKPAAPTVLEKEIAGLLAEARSSGAFASTAMILLDAMADKKLKGIDAPLAKRVLYKMTYKVVALREDAPELTKSDLLIYNDLNSTALKDLFDLMKNADPEKQEFRSAKYNRISRGYTFVVCGDGDIFALTVRPSDSGLFGAEIYIVTPKATLALRDFAISLLKDDPAGSRSRLLARDVTCDLQGANLRIAHRILLEKGFELVATIGPDRSTIRIHVEPQEQISDMHIGPADRTARCVYVGPDKTIQNPKSFILRAGEEGLTTRFVGLDFDNGVSLVQACENTPDFLDVDAEKRIYALHSHGGGSFWLAPSSRGASHAAMKYLSAVGQNK